MSGQSLTLEAVKEQFCITDKRDAMEKIRERLDDAWSMEQTAKLTAQIGEQMDKMCKDEGITFSPVQRIMWAVLAVALKNAGKLQFPGAALALRFSPQRHHPQAETSYRRPRRQSR